MNKIAKLNKLCDAFILIFGPLLIYLKVQDCIKARKEKENENS